MSQAVSHMHLAVWRALNFQPKKKPAERIDDYSSRAGFQLISACARSAVGSYDQARKIVTGLAQCGPRNYAGFMRFCYRLSWSVEVGAMQMFASLRPCLRRDKWWDVTWPCCLATYNGEFHSDDARRSFSLLNVQKHILWVIFDARYVCLSPKR